jgi:predicted nucleic acid-binding protein
MKVYLDVCCLNRPFDDPSHSRIALEASAVLTILELIESGMLTDYSSEMARVEIERNKDVDRRRRVESLLPPAERIIPLTDSLLDEAAKLESLGFGLADAAHLAAARQCRVDVFLTVDDKLLRRASRHAGAIGVKVMDPVLFLKESGHDRYG